MNITSMFCSINSNRYVLNVIKITDSLNSKFNVLYLEKISRFKCLCDMNDI